MPNTLSNLSEISTPSNEIVENQTARLVEHPSLRSSKRLVSLLNYVVRQTLAGSAHHLKERTIGVEVFNRKPDYDTSNDHIVRTAASELRKRLAVYYGDSAHHDELRIDIPVGSYVPQFKVPNADEVVVRDVENSVSPVVNLAPVNSPATKTHSVNRKILVLAALLSLVLIVLAWATRAKESSQSLFWHPLVRNGGSLMLVVGEMPQGPPDPAPDGKVDSPPSPALSTTRGFPVVDLGDAVAMTHIAAALAEQGRSVVVRPESATSFSDLQNGSAILLGAFNNEWSLRFTRPFRYSFALDADQHLLYIRDRQNPSNRSWGVIATDRVPYEARRSNGKPVIDYALISRVTSSETGKPMVIVGGLYVYGTEAASTLITDPQFENLIASLPQHNKVLQIVVQTNVTEGIPGPPNIVASS